jgi:uridylate kinase
MSPAAGYRRFVLKLTGESFCKEGGFGIDIAEVNRMVAPFIRLVSTSKQVILVVGGGNFIRGGRLAEEGVSRPTADQMGMLGTVINGLALQDILEKRSIETRVMSAVAIHDVCEPYIRRRALRHLERGRCVILVGGTGHPFFTTDTTAALRAAELSAEILFKGTKVDGVYSSDPKKHPDARKFDKLTYMEVLKSNLKVMDATAISLCRENALPIRVFNIKEEGNIERAVAGEPVGTIILPDEE